MKMTASSSGILCTKQLTGRSSDTEVPVSRPVEGAGLALVSQKKWWLICSLGFFMTCTAMTLHLWDIAPVSHKCREDWVRGFMIRKENILGQMCPSWGWSGKVLIATQHFPMKYHAIEALLQKYEDSPAMFSPSAHLSVMCC